MKKILTLLMLTVSLCAMAAVDAGMAKKSADAILRAAVEADKNREFDDAAELFAMAAEKGSYNAMSQLARYYKYGVGGTTKDAKLAREWADKYFRAILKEAEKGDPEIMILVGDSYCNPDLVDKKDPDESFRWYSKAADSGSAHAMNELAWCYDMGSGVEENIDEAIRLFELSIAGGYADSIEDLADLYYDDEDIPDNYQKALQWFLKDAEENNCGYCQYKVGEIYFFGDGVEADREVAKQWYEKAAANGYKYAQERLAENY